MESAFDSERSGSPVAELADAMDAHHLMEEPQPQMESPAAAMRPIEISVRGDLIELLQCFFCSKMLQRPISVCENGHSCCGDCKLRLRICGFCKGNFVASRNFLVENLLERFSVRCAHYEAGCEEFVKICDFLDHLNQCEHNPNPPAPEEGLLVDRNDETSIELDQFFRSQGEPFDVADSDFWRQEFAPESNDWNSNGHHDNRVDVRISLTVDRVGNNDPVQIDRSTLPASISAGREDIDLRGDNLIPVPSSRRTENEGLGWYRPGAAAEDAGRFRHAAGDESTRPPYNLRRRERSSDFPWLTVPDTDRMTLRQPANINQRGPGPAFRLSPSRRHRMDRIRSTSSTLTGPSSSASQPGPFLEPSPSYATSTRSSNGRHIGAQQRGRTATRYMPFVSSVRAPFGASAHGHEQFPGHPYETQLSEVAQTVWLRPAMMQPRGRHSIAGGPSDAFFHPVQSEIPVVFLEPALGHNNGFRI